MWRRIGGRSLLASGVLLATLCPFPVAAQLPRGLPQVPEPPEAQPPLSFADEIDVALSTLVVRVVDTWGKPVLDLKPDDFRIRSGGKEIPVVALDWIGEAPPAAEPAAAAADAAEGAPPADAPPPPSPRPGRQVLIFVQADLTPSRISGQLRLRPFTRELLDQLAPEDRVAVVSYDSHLKLRQDFTLDRAATHAAVDAAMLWGEPPHIEPGGADSLSGHFDFAAAFEAASPERALEVAARALEPLAGEKTMIFLGWGLGRFGGGGTRMTPAYYPAVRALRRAHAAVFVLDVTSADSHSLETGLEAVAEATGGLYLKTFRLPALATRTLSQAISGYYVLTLDRSQLGAHTEVKATRLAIELRDPRRGTVLARPAWVH
jgi:VWFA-related protein